LNLDLYIQSKKSQGEAPKRKLLSEVHAGGDVSHHLHSQSERTKSSKLSRRQHNNGKEPVRERVEPPPRQNSECEIHNTQLEEKTRYKVNHGSRSRSRSPVRGKRGLPGEQLKTKV